MSGGTTRVITAGVIASILAGGAACRRGSGGVTILDDEDRSQIIVRSGSVEFFSDKTWQYDDPSGKQRDKARPLQPKGAKVTGFEVTFSNPQELIGDDPSTTSSPKPCPRLPMVGTEVDVTYLPPGSTTAATLTFTMADNLQKNKKEPLITAPTGTAMDLDSAQTTLTFGQSGGAITRVTIIGNGGQEFCQPKTGAAITQFSVQPLR